MNIISKQEAKRRGLARYHTGIACKRGHMSERTVSRGDCLLCIKERQGRWNSKNSSSVNARSRKWYAKNKEKAADTRANWRAKNKAKDRANIAAYQAANKDKLKAAGKVWSDKNKDKRRSYVAKYRTNNKDRVLALASTWRRNNRDKVNAKKARRMAAKHNATPAWANDFFIDEAYDLAQIRTSMFGFEWHVDHIVPLQAKLVCGLHVEHNLQVIPGTINQSKSNRHWPDMPSRGIQ